MGAVHLGLHKVIRDVPLRSAYLEAVAGVSLSGGAQARIEGGAKPYGPLSLFAFGQWRPSEFMAGAGARLTWNF